MTDATTDSLRHPDAAAPADGSAPGPMTREGDGQAFDWSALVPRLVHPHKVTIVEAMACIGRPISACELERVFFEEISLGVVSYHMKGLVKAGALVKVGQMPVRGALQHFYLLSDRA